MCQKRTILNNYQFKIFLVKMQNKNTMWKETRVNCIESCDFQVWRLTLDNVIAVSPCCSLPNGCITYLRMTCMRVRMDKHVFNSFNGQS